MGLCDDVRESTARDRRGARATCDRPRPAGRDRAGAAARARPRAPLPRGLARGRRRATCSTLDAINFGSGWFPTLRKRPGCSGYYTVAWALADHFRAHGPWSNDELRAMTRTRIAAVLGQDRGHELMALYAEALRELGASSGPRRARRGRGGRRLGRGARAALRRDAVLRRPRLLQARADHRERPRARRRRRVRRPRRLTIFADNLVPHVLRVDGVLRYDDALAAQIDPASCCRRASEEREIRACAVHACELIAERLGVPPRDARHVALEPRPGRALQGAPAAPDADRLLLECRLRPPPLARRSCSNARRRTVRTPGRRGCVLQPVAATRQPSPRRTCRVRVAAALHVALGRDQHVLGHRRSGSDRRTDMCRWPACSSARGGRVHQRAAGSLRRRLNRRPGRRPRGRSGRTSAGFGSRPVSSASCCSSSRTRSRQRPDRVGDRVGQVGPVGVRALGLAALDPHRMAGVADDGGVRRHVVDDDGVRADLRAVADVIGPSSFAPEPIVTLSSTVGWRLPRAKPVPPSVTPW